MNETELLRQETEQLKSAIKVIITDETGRNKRIKGVFIHWNILFRKWF